MYLADYQACLGNGPGFLAALTPGRRPRSPAAAFLLPLGTAPRGRQQVGALPVLVARSSGNLRVFEAWARLGLGAACGGRADPFPAPRAFKACPGGSQSPTSAAHRSAGWQATCSLCTHPCDYSRVLLTGTTGVGRKRRDRSGLQPTFRLTHCTPTRRSPRCGSCWSPGWQRVNLCWEPARQSGVASLLSAPGHTAGATQFRKVRCLFT